MIDAYILMDIITDHNLCKTQKETLQSVIDKIEQGTLKEEKTCKNISEMHPSDSFICSECGIRIVDYIEGQFDEEEFETTFHEYEIKYCPNCGAKVVQNG